MNEAPKIIPLGQEPRPQAIPREAAPKPSSKAKPRRGKSNNRFAPLNSFVSGPLSKLKGRAAVGVWLVLFARTNRKTGLARISQSKLAELVGCSSRAVRTALNELEAAGLLDVQFRGNEFGGVSMYRLHPGKEQTP